MLYNALHEILVDGGTLDSLYLFRLPPEQVADVDVAFIPLSGVGATRSYGSAPVTGKVGVTHDGGVQWYHTGVQIQFRGRDPDTVVPIMELADCVRDVLVQFAPGVYDYRDETIVRVDVTNSPSFYEQDERDRLVAGLGLEVWHRPLRGPAAGRAHTSGFSRGFN